MITIRKAKEIDFEEYYSLWSLMEKQHRKRANKLEKEYDALSKNEPFIKRKTKKDFLKGLKSPRRQFFIAEDNKRVIGFLEVSRIKRGIIKKVSYDGCICDLIVYPKYEGKGVASLLKKAADKWFKDRKIEYIILDCFETNKHAMKIYEKWGFETRTRFMYKKLK